KVPRTVVMVDVDQKALLESLKARALDTVALQDNHGFRGRFRHILRMQDYLSVWKRIVDQGNGIAHDHLSDFSHLPEHLIKGEQRSNGVPIGASVRGEQKGVPLLYLL